MMIDRIPTLKAVSAVTSAMTVSAETVKTKSGGAHRAAFTSLPKLVQLARELAEHGPPVDHAKIARVRQAIAIGSYQIDTDAIATSMLLFSGGVNNED